MRRFFRFHVIIKWIGLSLLVLSLSFLLGSLVAGCIELKEKVEQLENNVEALSEWYIELKNENIDLKTNILDLTLEDFNIYTQIVKDKKSLNEIKKISVEGFKNVNVTYDHLMKKFTESDESKKKFNRLLKNLSKYQQDNIKLILDNRKKLKEDSKKPSYEYLKSITVIIQGKSIVNLVKGKLSQSWLGTGIIIKSGTFNTYILTNAHIAGKGKENTTLYVEDKYRTRLATIVKIHDKLDLALIKINGKIEGKRAIKGVSIRIKPQDKVYLVGHHLGRKYIYGEGVFAGYQETNDIIQIPVLFGNSGSGVFDKNGKLVSLIFGINRIGAFDIDCAHGLGIDSLNIIHFLRTTGIL